MAQFSGQRAIVWGGTSGINLGIARMFAARGAQVFLVSRSSEKVQAAIDLIRAEGGSADGMAADVRHYDQVEAAAARAAADGPLDIVISGAAGNFLVDAAKMSANAFRTVIDIDLIGTFNTARACYAHFARPDMNDGRGACYTAITAPQAVKPIKQQAHACAAKAGINMLLKCLALEWGAEGIRVNGISPGPIADTEGMRRLAPDPESEAASKAAVPLGRYGRKDEIAAAACYLASTEAAYITGTILDVDGGMLLAGSRLN